MSHPAPLHRHHRARCATVFVAALMLPMLAAGCGAGLAGGASAASSGGNSDPAPSRLVTSESMPVLSTTRFPAPTRADEFIEGAVRAEPNDTIRLQFSDPIDRSYSMSVFRVDILRPDATMPEGGEWVRVALESATSQTARSVTLTLPGDTLHNSLYRVSISGLMTSGGAVPVASSRTFFVVRDGEWRDAELVSLGGGFSGGVTLTEDYEHYATFESQTPLMSGGTAWGTWSLASSFGTPWRVPKQIYSREADGFGEQRTQLQTGRFLITDEIGLVRINESSPSVPDAENPFNTLRAAVGLNLGVTADPTLGGLQFGPIEVVSSSTELTGRVDRPGAAELGQAHFSFNGEFVAEGRSVGVTFWGLSELPSGNDFEHQRVYVNETMAAPFNGNLQQIRWADWGAAVRVSAAGEDHNSWPFLTQLNDGSAVAMWWSANSTAEIFSDEVERYWLARWNPTSGWSQAVDVTPAGEVGQLPPITDTSFVVDANGVADLIVFSRNLIAGSAPASYMPAARVLDLDLTTVDWSGATSVGQPTTGAGFSIPAPLNASNFVSLPYRNQLGRVRLATPRATAIGNNEFLVRWLDGDLSSADPFVSIHTGSSPTVAGSWQTPVDLSTIATISAGAGSASGINLSVDQNGWATLMFLQNDPATGLDQVFAKRANLPFGGTQGLGTGAPAQQISPSEAEVINSGLSNTHSSGAFSLTWDFEVPGTVNLGGSALRRFM